MSRIRANQITNQAADGAPTVQNGLIISGVTTSIQHQATNINVTGIVTATSFVGSGTNGIKLPIGTTGERVNTKGTLRYNSSNELPEYYLSLIHI